MHTQNTLVSITIPFLNGERFMREAIESVLSQSYPDWELYLVDDGSTDGGTLIAKDYVAKNPGRIFYLEHTGHRNLGLPASRNLGIHYSKGQYLAFLDSDDVWLPDKLENQMSVMEAFPEAGLVYGHSIFWYSWDDNNQATQSDEVHPLAPAGKLYRPPFLFENCYPLGHFGAPPPSAYMLRRWVFDLVGNFEESFNPDTFQFFEDAAFLAKVYLNVPVVVAEYCGDKYRCHPFSMSSNVANSGRQDAERQYYFNWLWRYLIRKRVMNPTVWKVALRRSWMYWLPVSTGGADFLRRIRRLLPI